MAAPKEGGFKMSLGGLKGKAGLKASPLQKEAKRPRLALGDDEPDDSVKQQEISGWDAAEGGALDVGGKKEKEGPRIIPALPNRDWRAEARRKQLAKAPHNQAQNGDAMEGVEEPKVHYGLTIMKKDEPEESTAAETAPSEPAEGEDNLTEEQRLEKKALDALLNGKPTDDDLVIPVQTEEEAFLNELHNAPDAPTLEAYEATPIEGFGAALLRGMGWKGEEDDGKNNNATKPKEVKRRPALLGIGAKEEAAVGVELGEWGSGKGKGKKFAQSYNPVTLRNKHTGEMITEEELKAKLESQEMVKDEEPEKGRRKYDDDDNKEDEKRREKRKEKRDDKERDRDRKYDDNYDSERRRDKDHRGDRRRDRDEYSDSDRRRDKRRDREEDYDSERRKDRRRDRLRDDDSERRRDKYRERSRSPDDRKEKRRDRYRSCSRDSKRERDRRDRSRDSDDRRKRRRERDYEREDDRKRRHKDDKYYK